MTPAELSSLPDISELECEIETLPNGESILHRKTLSFVQHEYNPNDIVMFADDKGTWFVVYGYEGGPHKRRAYF